MRKAFIEALTKIAQKDPKVILIVGDVGFSYVDEFAKKFPKQFINTGVTEQSMMGMAAGLALSGYKPYVYSMIPFVTFRCFEQLRNDVCYNKANVKIIGVKGSEHYKFLGFSHNIAPSEDFQALALLPNLDLFEPLTPADVTDIIEGLYEERKPQFIGRASYIRL